MSVRAAEYSVITGDTTYSLANAVNEALKLGWQPHGSAFFDGSHTGVYAQPMVRSEMSAKLAKRREQTEEKV
jgi:hypothetical protein